MQNQGKKPTFNPTIIGYTCLSAGLLIAYILLSKNLVLYANARFEAGKAITDFVIFVLSGSIYFVSVNGILFRTLLAGLIFSFTSYIISDLAIVNLIPEKYDLNGSDMVYFIIHIFSIGLLLLIQFGLRKWSRKA